MGWGGSQWTRCKEDFLRSLSSPRESEQSHSRKTGREVQALRVGALLRLGRGAHPPGRRGPENPILSFGSPVDMGGHQRTQNRRAPCVRPRSLSAHVWDAGDGGPQHCP